MGSRFFELMDSRLFKLMGSRLLRSWVVGVLS